MASYSNRFEVPVESIADSVDTPRGSAYLNAPPGVRDSSAISTPAESSPFLAQSNKEANFINSQETLPSRRPLYKRAWFWVVAIVAIVVVALAVVLPVIFVVVKPGHHHSTSGASSSSSGSSGSTGSGDSGSNSSSPTTTKTGITTGGDGSTVTKDDGTTFVYKNSFGGYWVSDPANPFDNSARPNSWTPPLNESWTWGVDRINGVNIGGLFVIEPFIVPQLFEQNAGTVDEWTLSVALGDKLQQTIEDHYNTFITEEDIAQIAGAGLNWIRVPIPFWAIEKWDNVGVDANGETVAEPFLARTCWKYILRLLGWARKYGIRVNLDLHTIPGSQNGYNHSGKLGSINWLSGVMGLANAERSLDYIRIVAEFVSQPEWRAVVPMFSMLNEPFLHDIGNNQVQSFYLKAYTMVREITGVGAGNGPMITIHDGFTEPANWAGFLPGADRLALDTHPYFAFDGQQNREPVNITADGDSTQLGGQWPLQACNSWGKSLNDSRSAFGVTMAGEFSNAINDCGLYVNGVGGSARYGAGCEYWQDASGWSDETKQGLLNFALASMDALGDWFFWTWKIGNSTTTNSVQAPLWSYQLGLENGWMPTDPRQALGKCASLGVAPAPFDGTFQSWQTGGAGAGTIAPSATADLVWPPASITSVPAGSVTALPQYTATGTLSTLPPPTFSASVTASVGNGWFDGADNAPAVTAISGCTYPDAWDADNAQIPLSGCLPAAR
ncbi:glycoside hydrolase [Dichomitus squalens LYAD-421 SS1]|uniref:glucan 1,3-beta-glucosidase n=1 Tax=Dichomitus squalens (strain LYAD-421) TaxID=732165 RepID=R7SNI0_DICSQ|nr:glycoside hydrolase [Dichomitus squalens LYAD-421 SS1]EJF57265.1 glycoside hydrolase [Dichomitus squalens LYAD-421 SS1]